MPKRVGENRLEKVISSKLTGKDFDDLEAYARDYYIQRKISQPTVSRLVRLIIRSWLKAREMDRAMANKPPDYKL